MVVAHQIRTKPVGNQRASATKHPTASAPCVNTRRFRARRSNTRATQLRPRTCGFIGAHGHWPASWPDQGLASFWGACHTTQNRRLPADHLPASPRARTSAKRLPRRTDAGPTAHQKLLWAGPTSRAGGLQRFGRFAPCRLRESHSAHLVWRDEPGQHPALVRDRGGIGARRSMALAQSSDGPGI